MQESMSTEARHCGRSSPLQPAASRPATRRGVAMRNQRTTASGYHPRGRRRTIPGMRRAIAIGLALVAGFVAGDAHANGRFPESLRLLEHPGNPDRLYLGATFGLLVSQDRGESWFSICEQAFALQYVEGDPLLEVLPDGTVLAGI